MVKKKIQAEHEKEAEKGGGDEDAVSRLQAKVGFDPAHYTVLENVGTFNAVVSREGGPDHLTVLVDFATEGQPPPCPSCPQGKGLQTGRRTRGATTRRRAGR